MDKLYQVFLSSTFVDLVDERRAVSNMLAKAGYMVAGMELFPATDQEQFDYIKTVIDRSDYYVVIVAGRYGSESNAGQSFTEMEFAYAKSRGIPVLAFIHSDPGSIASSRTDQDIDKAKKLDAFRKRLQTGRLVETWCDEGTLCAQIVIAVGNEKTLKPGIGWVRGDQAADPKVMQDLARLTIENKELQERLRALERDAVHFDPNLVGPSDDIELTIEQWHEGQERPNATVALPVGLLFVNLYDLLLSAPRETILYSEIGHTALVIDSQTTFESNRVDVLSLIRIRDQFEALGLIKAEARPAGNEGSAVVVWTVTDKGRSYAASMRALKKPKIAKKTEP